MENIVNENGLTEKEFLEKYNSNKYEKPSLTVDLLIFTIVDEEETNYRKLPNKKLKLLMIKRKDHPFIKQWALPGGFVSINESVEDAAKRELMEETGIEDIYIEQLYTWGDMGRDPRTRVVSCSYMALIDSSNVKIEAGTDAADAKWFEVNYCVKDKKNEVFENGYKKESNVSIILSSDDIKLNADVKIEKSLINKVIDVKRNLLNSSNIAFDHGIIIEYAIERLRNKIEYTDIVFNLMKEKFTLTDLQKAYEIILGKPLLPAAFRRKISNKVIETNEFTKDNGHRPSKLYKFNSFWENELS